MSKDGNSYHTKRRFPDRGGPGWSGPIVDYKELDVEVVVGEGLELLDV